MAPPPVDPPPDVSTPSTPKIDVGPLTVNLPPEKVLPIKLEEKLQTKKADMPEKKPHAPTKKLSIKHTIKNLAQLSLPTLPTDTPVVQPSLPEPKPVGTYFDALKIKSEITTNEGHMYTIDVQSDSRYLTAYLQQVSGQKYKDLTYNSDPYVSTPSYIGYNLCLFYAQQLILDTKCCHEASGHALPFLNEPRLSNFITTLMDCKVPTELAIELRNLAPVYDPLHSDLEYIPSLACFSLNHDFGRTIPAYIYFLIHNILADIENYQSPHAIMNEIYSCNIATRNEEPITLSNLFGGPFSDNAHTQNHQNWLRLSLERLLIPTIGLCLEEQPTLINLPLTVPRIDDQVNGYLYTLFGHRLNLTVIQQFMTKISKYLSDTDPSLPTLGSFLGKVSGITILSHSIETTVLPTWHSFESSEINKTLKTVTDKQMATKLNFCAPRPTFTEITIPKRYYHYRPTTLSCGQEKVFTIKRSSHIRHFWN